MIEGETHIPDDDPITISPYFYGKIEKLLAAMLILRRPFTPLEATLALALFGNRRFRQAVPFSERNEGRKAFPTASDIDVYVAELHRDAVRVERGRREAQEIAKLASRLRDGEEESAREEWRDGDEITRAEAVERLKAYGFKRITERKLRTLMEGKNRKIRVRINSPKDIKLAWGELKEDLARLKAAGQI